MNKKRIIVIATAIVTTLIVMMAISLFLLNSSNNAKLDILVAPSTAKIIINEKEYQNGIYSFKPSKVTAIISMDGFVTQEIGLDLEADKTTQLYTYLEPSNGDLSWYIEHPAEGMLLNSIGDALATKNSEIFTKTYSISEILPIIIAKYDGQWNYTEYRIDGGSFDDCPQDFCIKITDVTGGNYEDALNLIREKGYNPNDYQIIYENDPIQPLD